MENSVRPEIVSPPDSASGGVEAAPGSSSSSPPGETAAWQAWLDDEGPGLLLYARQQTRDEADAQDVFQEALSECWRRCGRRVPDRSLVAATIRRRAIDLGRSMITGLAGERVGTPGDLRRVLRDCEAGERVDVTYLRRGSERTANAVLAESPQAKDQPEPPPEAGKAGGGGGDLHLRLEIDGGAMDGVMGDPNIPESFKEQLRKMQERMREFERQPVPGAAE